MTEPPTQRASTQVSLTIKAPRTAIYRACLDPDALASWRVPDNMTAEVHTFDAREGGRFRMTLSYDAPGHAGGGKTTEATDTFQGRFLQLVPENRIVELIEFESDDPRFAGEMQMTTTLTDAGDGTEVTVLCEGLPPGVRPEDNQAGTEQALQKLAALVAG